MVSGSNVCFQCLPLDNAENTPGSSQGGVRMLAGKSCQHSAHSESDSELKKGDATLAPTGRQLRPEQQLVDPGPLEVEDASLTVECDCDKCAGITELHSIGSVVWHALRVMGCLRYIHIVDAYVWMGITGLLSVETYFSVAIFTLTTPLTFIRVQCKTYGAGLIAAIICGYFLVTRGYEVDMTFGWIMAYHIPHAACNLTYNFQTIPMSNVDGLENIGDVEAVGRAKLNVRRRTVAFLKYLRDVLISSLATMCLVDCLLAGLAAISLLHHAFMSTGMPWVATAITIMWPIVILTLRTGMMKVATRLVLIMLDAAGDHPTKKITSPQATPAGSVAKSHDHSADPKRLDRTEGLIVKSAPMGAAEVLGRDIKISDAEVRRKLGLMDPNLWKCRRNGVAPVHQHWFRRFWNRKPATLRESAEEFLLPVVCVLFGIATMDTECYNIFTTPSWWQFGIGLVTVSGAMWIDFLLSLWLRVRIGHQSIGKLLRNRKSGSGWISTALARVERFLHNLRLGPLLDANESAEVNVRVLRSYLKQYASQRWFTTFGRHRLSNRASPSSQLPY
ncbi:hypothetical protein BC832DRAFT_131397 [Gaertneriomyces semiglobifer]|nr:hypothetical protein BC832DRAFT_131397 [Gaertneriomyces semiglobifer]